MGAERGELSVERGPDGGVSVTAKRDGPLAHSLHQLQRRRALLLREHLAQQRAEQPDLARKRVARPRAPQRARLRAHGRVPRAGPRRGRTPGSAHPGPGATAGAIRSIRRGRRAVTRALRRAGRPRARRARRGRPRPARREPRTRPPVRAGRVGRGTPRRFREARCTGVPRSGREASASLPRTERRAAARARGRVRGPVPRGRPLAGPGNAHHARIGQTPQAGRPGRQTVAPRSISACVQSAGRFGIHQCIGGGLHLAGRDRQRLARRQATQNPPDVHVHRAHRPAERDRGHRPGRVGTHPGQRLERRDIRRNRAPGRDDDPGRPLEVDGAPVVAQAAPRPDHVARGRRREVRRRRKPVHERAPLPVDPGNLGLLRHHLADQDRPWIGLAMRAERQGAAAAIEPGQERCAQPDDVSRERASRSGEPCHARKDTRGAAVPPGMAARNRR